VSTPAKPPDTIGARPGDLPDLTTVERGHYRVESELGRGGMGRILNARDCRHGRPVAIKELLADTPTLELRFQREALITARLQHPAIVPVYEAGRWPSGEPFYAMELARDPTLEGTVNLRFTIDESDRVSDLEVSGFDDRIVACVRGLVVDWEFPGAGPTGIITYPLIYRPVR
jgi:serine/threonine protein kinase